jgi:O-methyltransferase involved in polyketide biosynthesis
MIGSFAGVDAAAAAAKRSLGVDLNKEAAGVPARLQELGLTPGVPTLFISEAVLFYLSPPAKRTLLADCAKWICEADGSALALTDNLAPFVRSPSADEAAELLEGFDLELQRHDSLWGGAIQFLHATAKTA